MILGIGNDIIEIERIRGAIDRYHDRFLQRIFTSKEQAYCQKRKDSAVHFAGRFAAKEAIVKALGTGFSHGISWLDIEIIPDTKGKPIVVVSPLIEQLFEKPVICLSISHCKNYATAFAIWTDYNPKV